MYGHAALCGCWAVTISSVSPLMYANFPPSSLKSLKERHNKMDAKKRILYIEDNFQNRRLVNRLLTKRGYEVIEAEDGLQGIAIAAREKPALILMDINLPGIDGMEATSRIKSSRDLSHI